MGSTGSGNAQGSGHFSIYDYNNGADRLLIHKTTGNIGIGTVIPAEKLSVETSATNDGISLTQTGTSASALHLYNTGSGGNHFALFSTGSGNSQGAGNFSIFQYGAGDRFFIDGATGNIGIGTASLPGYTKFYAPYSVVPVSGNNNYGGLFELNIESTDADDWSYAVAGKVTANSGVYENAVGVYGNVNITNNVYSRAVVGIASGAASSSGGVFSGTGGSGGFGVGVEAYGSDIGIDASASGAGTYAGYFSGNVFRTGTDNFLSDQKFKNDIKPLVNVIEKIKSLKPSTYTFKTDDEFKGMNLPKGTQIGLIAQELEKVFPELVTEMAARSKRDKNDKTISTPSFKSVQYISLIPILISGIQEQQKQLENQTKTNDSLKTMLKLQQQQINELVNNTSGITGINQMNNQMNGFSMEQNIPNPFSRETVVNYTLPQQTGSAYMAVYDLSGKQIASFPLNQKGASAITISSEKLAAGVYIYSIIADGKLMDSKRMIVEDKQ